MPKQVHVAVAIIRDSQGRVLIARRPDSVHQGGKLEFPGGKVETGESVQQALQRELYEELGIRAEAATMQRLIKITHDYTNKSVCLDVWQVLEFSGEAYGKEGQPVFWFDAGKLKPEGFPAANAPIIEAINLPQQLMISPDIVGSVDEVVTEIKSRIERHGIKRVILRLPRIEPNDYECIAGNLVALFPQVRWQLHSDIALTKRLNTGLHLSSKALGKIDAGQLCGLGSISVSIHNTGELKQAEALGVDFTVLGSVQKTETHQNADTLGWQGFATIVGEACIPVYALGGMQQEDLPRSLASGAQGIAGISLFAVE